MVFFAIIVIYPVSPLIQVKRQRKDASGADGGDWHHRQPEYRLTKIDGFEWLPVNLYINGDTFYYVLYGMLGRAIGMMDTQKRGISWLCGALFIIGVIIISRGTLHELQWRGNFADTVPVLRADGLHLCRFLLTLVKNTLNAHPLPVLGFISRHSLGIYGFHALVIHALRTRGVELKSWPVLDIVWIFSVTLVVSLLLSMLLQKQTPAASSVNDALSGPMKLARGGKPCRQ